MALTWFVHFLVVLGTHHTGCPAKWLHLHTGQQTYCEMIMKSSQTWNGMFHVSHIVFITVQEYEVALFKIIIGYNSIIYPWLITQIPI